MFRTRLLARLSVLAFGAISLQSLAAENGASTPPANSIRESMSKATPTPTASPSPTAAPIVNEPATPAANPPAKPVRHAAAPKSPIRISIKSPLQEGNLVILIDDVPIFNGKFEKSLLLISQIAVWDPVLVAVGAHKLAATVYGPKKIYFSSTYDLQLSRTKGAALRFVMKGDKLNVALAS